MNKVKIFHEGYDYEGRNKLEEKINKFAKLHEIVNVSICVVKHGYNETYTAAVTYKE